MRPFPGRRPSRELGAVRKLWVARVGVWGRAQVSRHLALGCPEALGAFSPPEVIPGLGQIQHVAS